VDQSRSHVFLNQESSLQRTNTTLLRCDSFLRTTTFLIHTRKRGTSAFLLQIEARSIIGRKHVVFDSS
jgi:hypothetical protein